MSTVHLIIHGKVQGVFYRASAKRMAEQSNIKGWIRNSPEGNVEIIAQGADEQVEKFIHWCKQGPSGARVDNCLVEPAEEQPFHTFNIVH
ncbi:MAG: acylphosphatase [Chitinophagaceae bacterium]